MKKIVLMMLVALVPFLTMAQKKAKKKKNVKTEINEGLNASYEFMVITGYEIVIKEKVRVGSVEEVSNAFQVKQMMNTRTIINFDFGRVKSNVISSLLKNSRSFRTMSGAVNAAANEGWNFVSSNVVLSGETKIHYYYMRKNK